MKKSITVHFDYEIEEIFTVQKVAKDMFILTNAYGAFTFSSSAEIKDILEGTVRVGQF